MKSLFILFSAYLSFVSLNPKDKKQIEQVIISQQEAWNRGDIPGFMEGYWDSDSLTFISKRGIKKGYQTVLQQYIKGYPDRQTMGQLTFDILEWNTECELVVVTGKWSLKREKEPVEGYFTLWFKNIHGSWKIVKDHTS